MARLAQHHPPLPTAAEWAERLGLRKAGSEFCGPCPIPDCGGDDRFHVQGGAARALVGCRNCMDGQPPQRKAERFGMALRAAFPERFDADSSASRRQKPEPKPPKPSSRRRDESAKADAAQALFSAAAPIAAGNPAWRYLVLNRMVWPPALALPDNLRWAPASALPRPLLGPLPIGCAGALLFAFRKAGAESPPVQAVQAEALTPDGSLPPERWRRTLGASAGSLFLADGGPGMAVGEGPLDALALRMLTGCAAIASGGSAGMAKLPAAALLRMAGDGDLEIWPDADSAGWRAGRELAGRCKRLGRPATIVDCQAHHDAAVKGAKDPADLLRSMVRLEAQLAGGAMDAEAVRAAWQTLHRSNEAFP